MYGSSGSKRDWYRFGKKYAKAVTRYFSDRSGMTGILPTAYAANDAHGGMIVTEPLCRDDFWTAATRHVQMLATAIARRIYLAASVLFLNNAVNSGLQAVVRDAVALHDEVHQR
jgi:hypothetical protein